MNTSVSGYKGIQRGLLKDKPKRILKIKFFFLFAIIKGCKVMIKNMKQTKAWLGAFALLIMVGVTTLTFAFKADGKVDNKRLTTYYFEYQGSNSEAEFEDSDNWTNITSVPPEESPCSGAEQIVCTLRADFESTPTSTDIANYLQGLAPLSPNGASLYCNNPSNIVYYKPN